MRIVRLLKRDARFTMPPAPMALVGAEAIMRSSVEGGFGSPPYDDFRCLVTRANGVPAVANYLGVEYEAHYRPFTVDVLRIEDGAITEITAFEADDRVSRMASGAPGNHIKRPRARAPVRSCAFGTPALRSTGQSA
jgi:hypothetical protein